MIIVSGVSIETEDKRQTEVKVPALYQEKLSSTWKICVNFTTGLGVGNVLLYNK